MKKKKFDLSALTRSKIFWAVIAELLILLVCLIIRPDFFKISYQPSTGMLYGSLIDIINRSAEITIIAMGMTLVIALGGTDLSVGALVAVSGAIAISPRSASVVLPFARDSSSFPTVISVRIIAADSK